MARAAGLPARREQPATPGILLRYLFGIGPAVLHAGLRGRDRRHASDRGVLYGLAILVVWDQTLSVALGMAGPPRAYPWQAHARGLIGHLSPGVAPHVALTARCAENLRARVTPVR